MGHGTWTRTNFETYARAAGRKVDTKGNVTGSYTAQEMFKSRSLAPALNPKGVIRECCETEEHPNTIPVILALDVTGSMGRSAVEFAQKLNTIMTSLYEKVKDVEFLIMGIGDFMYDEVPLQASQFESDIRIAEQLDQIYFEGHGGGNSYESYTAAWYFAARHTRLDCWKRGQKGILITIGDELINPYIPLQGRHVNLRNYLGDNVQDDIETADLLKEVLPKYEVFHLVADHNCHSHYDAKQNAASFAEYLGAEHVSIVTIDTLAQTLVDIIVNFTKESEHPHKTADGMVTWNTTAAEAAIITPEATNITTAEDITNAENTPIANGFFARVLSRIAW